jgi:hypothetical protein
VKKRKAEDKRNDLTQNGKRSCRSFCTAIILAFQQFSTPLAQAKNVGAMVEEKITMKMEIMQEIWG